MSEIRLTTGETAVVDDEDFGAVNQFCWYADRHSRTTYAKRVIRLAGGNYSSESMHKFLTGFALTDHINGDGLDNRRQNLREATVANNLFNAPKPRGSHTSKYKGVDRWRTKWRVQLSVNGKNRYVGSYIDETHAAHIYDDEVRRLRGEFAWTNFPQPGDSNYVKSSEATG